MASSLVEKAADIVVAKRQKKRQACTGVIEALMECLPSERYGSINNGMSIGKKNATKRPFDSQVR